MGGRKEYQITKILLNANTIYLFACMKLAISIMTIITRHFDKASKILECFESFLDSCRGINKLFSLFLTWLFVPQSSTSSAILNRKETTRMRFEHPGWNASFAKACGCAPPRTLPDLVKKRWGNGQLKAIFGFHAVLRRSAPVSIVKNCLCWS